MRVRVVCARPYHALFAHNLLIQWVLTGLPGWQGEGDLGASSCVRFGVTPGCCGWPRGQLWHAMVRRMPEVQRSVP